MTLPVILEQNHIANGDHTFFLRKLRKSFLDFRREGQDPPLLFYIYNSSIAFSTAFTASAMGIFKDAPAAPLWPPPPNRTVTFVAS